MRKTVDIDKPTMDDIRERDQLIKNISERYVNAVDMVLRLTNLIVKIKGIPGRHKLIKDLEKAGKMMSNMRDELVAQMKSLGY